MNQPLRFRFDPEKLVAALTFFASRGVPDLDVMKSLKLIYFADKAHLLKYGRPILGDTYYGMEHGPVASHSYDVMRGAIGRATVPTPQELVQPYLSVQPFGDLHRFVAKREPDMDVFSDSDVEILEATIEKYGNKSSLELSKLTHKERDVQHADKERERLNRSRVEIPYELFFSEDDAKILAAVQADQENQDFADAVAW